MKHTNMDEGLKHEKMTQVLTERGRPPSPRPAVLTNQWDSVESDTESLAQERAYQQQQQLQMPIGRHDQNKYILPQKENADSLQQGHKEAEYANDNKTEDLQVCDSLDVAAHPHANRNPTLSQTEYLDTQMDERAGTSQLLTDDVYSELRYDPNWRTNLRGASCFNENPRISVEEYYEVPKEKSRQSCGDSQGLRIKAGYRYIIDTSPAAVVTPHLTGNESDQPYRLHPQHGQTGSVTSPHCHNHALQLGSPEADHSKPSCIFTKDDSDNAGEYSRSPEQPNDICAMSKNIHERTQGGPTQIQQMSTPSVPKVLLNKKLERLTEDIVERNKKTLGRNTSKCGSYVSVHALNREMPHPVNKGHGTLKKTASTDSQEDSSDPKPKTQQLRVTQISEGKKAQRKENPNRPPQQQQTPALGVSAESEDRLSSSLAKPAAAGQPNPQKTTSSQPLVSNIHLNTSSTLLPLIQQRGQEDIINLACSDACPNWSPLSELALSPGYQLTIPGRSSQTSHKGVSAHLHQQNLESSPEQWQRTAALKWLLSCEGEDQKCPNEVQTKQFPPNLPRTPTTTFSGSYTVLPPITESTAGKEPELSPGVNTAYPIHSSCSDSYLGQMEKQKQLRTRVAYKAYSLKDYKQLKSDINLRGLGPDYSAIEKTAEKMKRQKLYSNVIREQNKTISRIPFLLAKDPEGNDKKVPRMKALEYAKTIAKPPVQSQPKQRPKHRSEGFTEPAPYLEDLDVSQLATLEVLRKRHEEEKQAVALFRKVHAV